MITLRETPDLRWFDPFASCQMCGKSAAGLLRGVRNESYGAHCQRCADKRLKQSQNVREMLAKEQSA
jgi:hypothetical protein